ncbi:MAG TPA: DUF2809 domain-containing protein [Longimicrobiaceae bacterium]|nr:DUF2809 domain-containing protein [Longimicrobiaceae bacterium]
MPPARPRSRALYLALALAVVALGLASRRFRPALPPFLGAYAGDALWAGMVFFLGAAARPRARVSTIATGALLFSFAVEATQLYRAPWIAALRATRPGGLVLGHDFVWSDLLCYAAGVLAAAATDLSLRSRAARTAARA